MNKIRIYLELNNIKINKSILELKISNLEEQITKYI